MQRYESGTKANKRFWEIAVIGAEVRTRHGRVGSDGRTSDPKVFAGEEEARQDAERRIADKVKKGFEPVDDYSVGQARDPALIEAILEHPDEEGPYLVYGDWLQAQGDVRGELVMLQHQQGARDGDSKLEKREKALRKKLTPSHLHDMLKKKPKRGAADSGMCEVEWRLGFIHRARIGRDSDRPPHTVRELVAMLLTHGSAQVLQSLTIGALGPADEYDYGPVIEEICLAAPVSLRELFVADFAPEHAELALSTLGDVSGLYPVLPRLERLHLRGGSMVLGAVDLPGLRELAITMSTFDQAVLASVAAASWPRLGKLALRAGSTPLPGAGLEALLAADMAALRHLGLMDTDDTGDVVRMLQGARVLSRLEVLDVSGGSLTDRDAEALLGQRHAFEHLRRLDVEGNYLSDEAVAALGEICADVRAGHQRPPAVGRLSVTDEQIVEFAPDARSMAAARKVVTPKKWPDLGNEGSVLWGRCQGGDLYDVYVDMSDMESGCTCPSMKYPCKHAIALLLMAQSHAIPPVPPPPGFIEACAQSYGGMWE